jgi:hypothetical protein
MQVYWIWKRMKVADEMVWLKKEASLYCKTNVGMKF